ncbi:MAG: methyltransferase domain-containing protein [Pirellulaceae bacterium]|nr:methyltransferase domain-containing protein [Pirellulaceae bacterium]
MPFAGEILPPDQWAKTALKRLPETGAIDFVELFGRDAPRVLDIGCGNGRFLLSSAGRRPEMDHVGIDPLPMVIRYATRRANMRGLANCRLAVCDGARFLRQYCAAGSFHEIHVYHPQPFPERAQQHQRLFQHDFLWQLYQALSPAGLLVVQTDNAAYWNYLQAVLPAITRWQVQDGPWPEDPQGRSRREIMARHKGLTLYRGWGVKLPELDAEEFARRAAQLPQPDFNAAHNRNPNGWARS